MNLIYISHPYTGNEEQNKEEAMQISADLAKLHPEILFINPLSAMQHTTVAGLDYEPILKQCLTLLSKCDGMIMTGDWQNSKGCNAEFQFAKENKMRLWNSVDEFKFSDQIE